MGFSSEYTNGDRLLRTVSVMDSDILQTIADANALAFAVEQDERQLNRREAVMAIVSGSSLALGIGAVAIGEAAAGSNQLAGVYGVVAVLSLAAMLRGMKKFSRSQDPK
jgi:hypothetical protein